MKRLLILFAALCGAHQLLAQRDGLTPLDAYATVDNIDFPSLSKISEHKGWLYFIEAGIPKVVRRALSPIAGNVADTISFDRDFREKLLAKVYPNDFEKRLARLNRDEKYGQFLKRTNVFDITFSEVSFDVLVDYKVLGESWFDGKDEHVSVVPLYGVFRFDFSGRFLEVLPVAGSKYGDSSCAMYPSMLVRADAGYITNANCTPFRPNTAFVNLLEKEDYLIPTTFVGVDIEYRKSLGEDFFRMLSTIHRDGLMADRYSNYFLDIERKKKFNLPFEMLNRFSVEDITAGRLNPRTVIHGLSKLKQHYRVLYSIDQTLYLADFNIKTGAKDSILVLTKKYPDATYFNGLALADEVVYTYDFEKKRLVAYRAEEREQ